ncbi:MAG: family N-acetyltransferase [Geminicoccaceae bacterium]|nr:family N-acetyltransferase [Geminicoccaceae bacterium]
MVEIAAEQSVAAVRRFNRFYTKQIGALHEGLLQSPFALTEARVLYELAEREGVSATELGRELDLDAGYLSRILRRFGERGLIRRTPSQADRRQSHLWLTERGRAAFALLDQASRAEVGEMLAGLSAPERRTLLDAMSTLERLLGGRRVPERPYVLRDHRPGDLGWVVHRHGVLYAQEYGWDERFEALVAGIVAQFVERCDPTRERCWIAERDGEKLGAVFLVRESEQSAKLRLLLVEPKARGLGIGTGLVQECEAFAREAGYRTIRLWTNSVLHAARHIYERAGYRLVHEEPHHSFGHDLVGETWELQL